MRFVTENGNLILTCGNGEAILRDISCGLNVKEGDCDVAVLTKDGWSEDGGRFVSGPASLTVRSDGEELKFISSYESRADVARCDEFVVLRGTFAERIVRFLRHQAVCRHGGPHVGGFEGDHDIVEVEAVQ